MATNKTNKEIKKMLLYEYFDELIHRKRNAGTDATADLYRTTTNWIKKFTNGRSPMLREITPGFIDNFRNFLQSQGHFKVNSIVSYISNFRAMYNTAVRERIIHPRVHPFSHLSLHQEKTAKRAVSKEVIENICKLDLEEEPELALAADICLFSYLACGMPFIDLVHLTSANILDNDIIYNRIKTGSPIRVRITSGMQKILDKYKRLNEKYLFPILSSTRETSHEKYKSLLYGYNTCLYEIGSRLKIPIHLTSYVIRHTWATEALRQHTPVAIISQALGHTSEKTTRYYLDQLDQSELNSANTLITNSVDDLLLKRA